MQRERKHSLVLTLIAALHCNGQSTFSCCCTALSSTRSDPQLGVLTLREQEFASFNSPKDKLP